MCGLCFVGQTSVTVKCDAINLADLQFRLRPQRAEANLLIRVPSDEHISDTNKSTYIRIIFKTLTSSFQWHFNNISMNYCTRSAFKVVTGKQMLMS